MEGPGASRERRTDSRSLVDRLDALARRARARGPRVEETADEGPDRTVLLAQAELRINTTLALIEGWARTLEQHWDTLAADTRENGLVTIRRRALEARHEVQDLLLDARAQLTDAGTRSSRVDVSLVLGQTVTAYQVSAPDVDVSFVGQSPLYAWVDVFALNRICSLLIDNAVTCSPHGGEITVCASAREANLVVEVVDQGISTPSELNVCAPDGSGSRGERHPFGPGLALHAVRTLARSMGGDVSYHRNQRRGSTFEVLLPLDHRPGVPQSN